jgi:hypothetical protein
MTASLYEKNGFPVELTEDGRDFTVATTRQREMEPSSRETEGKNPQNMNIGEETLPSGVGGGTPVQEPETEEDMMEE